MDRRIVISGVGLLALSTILLAQPGPQGGGFGGGGGGGGRVMFGAGNSAQFRQQQLDAIKQQFESTDEEWEKISPKIEKVLDAKHNTLTGSGLGFSSMNGGPPVAHISESKLDTPAGKAMQDVREALQDKDTPPVDLTKKLAALKEAIDKAREELQAAQKELADALAPRQLAILATMGIAE